MKRVRFSEKIKVHEIGNCADDKSSRNGLQWIQAAADRQRFEIRIQRTSLILNDVLRRKLEEIK